MIPTIASVYANQGEYHRYSIMAIVPKATRREMILAHLATLTTLATPLTGTATVLGSHPASTSTTSQLVDRRLRHASRRYFLGHAHTMKSQSPKAITHQSSRTIPAMRKPTAAARLAT